MWPHVAWGALRTPTGCLSFSLALHSQIYLWRQWYKEKPDTLQASPSMPDLSCTICFSLKPSFSDLLFDSPGLVLAQC